MKHSRALFFIPFACVMAWLGKDGQFSKATTAPIEQVTQQPPSASFDQQLPDAGMCIMSAEDDNCTETIPTFMPLDSR
jgi:hypothetical protein